MPYPIRKRLDFSIFIFFGGVSCCVFCFCASCVLNLASRASTFSALVAMAALSFLISSVRAVLDSGFLGVSGALEVGISLGVSFYLWLF